ncbi:MAG: hypothetical protein ACR2GI_07670 [Thermomicrobiales bacterium]
MTESYGAGIRNSSPQDPIRHGAAVFIGEVLGITDSPDYLASDLSPIKRDANASIYTIQLDSSVGPAAFMVYAYVLDERGGDGRTGKENFDLGLATLQKAAERSTPGPRSVAHTETGDFGFILATTPGTYRALAGESEASDPPGSAPEEFIGREESDRIRGELAQELLRTLRTANAHASEWLSAVRIASQSDIPDEGGIDDLLEFTEDETELALYLLDDQSIGNLLRALSLLVATAQQHTAKALENER